MQVSLRVSVCPATNDADVIVNADDITLRPTPVGKIGSAGVKLCGSCIETSISMPKLAIFLLIRRIFLPVLNFRIDLGNRKRVEACHTAFHILLLVSRQAGQCPGEVDVRAF